MNLWDIGGFGVTYVEGMRKYRVDGILTWEMGGVCGRYFIWQV